MPRSSQAKVFEALGDPVRRGILHIVASGEHPAGALVASIREHAPISQPAVSQHLRVLREAGLVRVRSEGIRRIYTLEPDGIIAAQEWLTSLLDPMTYVIPPLDALAVEVARCRRERRKKAQAARNGDDGSTPVNDDGTPVSTTPPDHPTHDNNPRSA